MSLHDKQWRSVCSVEDLVEDSGVCVLVNEDTDREQQVALFNIGGDQVFAVSNFDPFGKANVLYRGIVGSINERYVVASPLYKQHFDLQNGQCVEDESVALSTFEVRFENNNVELFC
jgi:nitrite reductase (NADH) small subunit